MFHVSGPYLYTGICPDPKHFIVNFEQNIVKYTENGWAAGEGGGGAGAGAKQNA